VTLPAVVLLSVLVPAQAVVVADTNFVPRGEEKLYRLPSRFNLYTALVKLGRPPASELLLAIVLARDEHVAHFRSQASRGAGFGTLRGFTWDHGDTRLALCFSLSEGTNNVVVIADMRTNTCRVLEPATATAAPLWTRMRLRNSGGDPRILRLSWGRKIASPFLVMFPWEETLPEK
jgi:hypothetical protein